MQDEEVKQLLNELDKNKREISQLKGTLSSISRQKEDCLKKKEKVQEGIRNSLSDIRKLKETRDKHTVLVKDLKKQRDSLNKKVGQDISHIQNLKKESLKGKKEESASYLRFQIKKLEEKIETDVISFNKEKDLMKQIKTLKKKLEDAKEKEVEQVSFEEKKKNIKQEKKAADKTHKEIQEHAKQSQECHEEILKISKDIDGLREKEKELEEKFLEHKIKIAETSKELKAKINRLNEIKHELEKRKIILKEDREKKEKELLKQKNIAVQEKLEKKKKLTTDDLLILQGIDKE